MINKNVNKKVAWLNFATGSCRYRKIKKSLALLFIIITAILLSACQVTAPPTTEVNKDISNNIAIETFSYSQYYLWLKTINNQQILAEELQYKTLIASHPEKDNSSSQSKLILIYSLPTTTFHQPYKAKRLLNEHLIINNNINQDNLAFSMLLRDQLNTQLHLLEKQHNTNKECNRQLDERHQLIEQLKKQVNQVNQQLILLKKIDLNINKRGKN